jgi:hypothetical protein
MEGGRSGPALTASACRRTARTWLFVNLDHFMRNCRPVGNFPFPEPHLAGGITRQPSHPAHRLLPWRPRRGLIRARHRRRLCTPAPPRPHHSRPNLTLRSKAPDPARSTQQIVLPAAKTRAATRQPNLRYSRPKQANPPAAFPAVHRNNWSLCEQTEDQSQSWRRSDR